MNSVPSMYTTLDDSGPNGSGWATFIGIVICICGNVVISFALNLQRLAHERIQKRIDAAEERQPAQPQSQEPANYGTRGRSTNTKGSDEEEDEFNTQYLKSSLWWTGMVLMVIGEAGNFVAYGFAPASIVAPLGTVAILCNALVAPLVFHETFRLRDFSGIVLATAGAVTIVLSANPQEEKLSPDDIWEAITETPFLIYFTICSILALILVYLSRRVGERSITIDLGLVAIFGGFTALSTKGISSLLSMSLYLIFTYPIAYLLFFVLTTTAILQVKYLNKALARFSSTQVIPTQFVMFTLSVVLGSSILYKDFAAATPERLLKFIFGCISTFIGVYLITSKRHTHVPKHRRSTPHLAPPTSSETEAEPLIMLASDSSSLEGETPPYLIGTSFGYHFAKPKVITRRGSRYTLPTGKRRDDIASSIWSRWRRENGVGEGEGAQMQRTQSDRPAVDDEQDSHDARWGRDSQSDIGVSEDSWRRSRGHSVV